MTRFQPVPCAVTSNYISDYNIGCFDPYEIDKSPMTTSDGTTYNYVNNPPDSVSLNVATGSFDNSGNLYSYFSSIKNVKRVSTSCSDRC